MSDSNEGGAAGTAGPAGEGQPGQQGPQLTVLTQYIKDLSFENPNAPMSLASGQPQPQIDVSVDVQARKRAEDQFEVELTVNANAKANDQSLFIVELVYAGFFGIRGVPQENLQPLLLIECPRLLFPFARRVIADTTREGGFPPLLLDPIDFVTMYRQQLARQQEAQAGDDGAGETAPKGNGDAKNA